MIRRTAARRVRDALRDTPAVLVIGARQAGKSTLVESVLDSEWTYVTLDDAAQLASAEHDPVGFLGGRRGRLAVDEVQKAPGLLPAIKASIDRRRVAGSFLLTGSANVLTLPRVAESLAGRVEVVTLWPLGQHEIEATRHPAPLLARLLSPDARPLRAPGSSGTWRARAIAGGYPEAVSRTRPERRSAWFASYVTTVLARDVRDVADISGVTSLPRLLRLLATRAGGLANVADLGRTLAVPATTLKRHLGILETLFLVHPLPPWSANLGRRLVRTPKLHLTDSGLLAHLLGVTDARVQSVHDGALLEGFAVMEIAKQAAEWRPEVSCFHFRAHEGQEVDVVLEEAGGRVVGIEIKATRSPTAADFRGLRFLESALGSRFARGVVLYTGDDTIPFGEKLSAMPLAALWTDP